MRNFRRPPLPNPLDLDRIAAAWEYQRPAQDPPAAAFGTAAHPPLAIEGDRRLGTPTRQAIERMMFQALQNRKRPMVAMKRTALITTNTHMYHGIL